MSTLLLLDLLSWRKSMTGGPLPVNRVVHNILLITSFERAFLMKKPTHQAENTDSLILMDGL